MEHSRRMSAEVRNARPPANASALCPSAWAVIVLYSGLGALCVILAASFALTTRSAVLVGFLAVASALSLFGAIGTYRRLTGRPGPRGA